MFVGILQFELLVRGSGSLKDKRRVVKSVKDRLHREHMVSVAEVGALEDHTLTMMGLAVVSNSAKHANEVLDHVSNKLRGLLDAELGDTRREIISGQPIEDADKSEPLWTDSERRDAEGQR